MCASWAEEGHKRACRAAAAEADAVSAPGTASEWRCTLGCCGALGNCKVKIHQSMQGHQSTQWRFTNMARAIQLVGASCDANNIEQQLLAFNMCSMIR